MVANIWSIKRRLDASFPSFGKEFAVRKAKVGDVLKVEEKC